MPILDICLTATSAEKGEPDAAIQMIRMLSDHLKDGKPLTPDAKKYFVNCFDEFLEKVDKATTSRRMQSLISMALNLTKRKGQKPNDILADYNLARQIDEIAHSRKIGIDEAIIIFMNGDDRYAKQAFNDSTDNLRRIYYKYLEVIRIEDVLEQEWLEDFEKNHTPIV